MSLKQMYESKNMNAMDFVVDEIVKRCEEKILSGSHLPFYISNVDIGYVRQDELSDVLKNEHGIVTSYFPNGVVIHDLIEDGEGNGIK